MNDLGRIEVSAELLSLLINGYRERHPDHIEGAITAIMSREQFERLQS